VRISVAHGCMLYLLYLEALKNHVIKSLDDILKEDKFLNSSNGSPTNDLPLGYSY
jgi:hypothetical protein